MKRWHPRHAWGRRPRIPFRAVNRRGTPTFDPALQRHHLLPRQLLSFPCFTRLVDALGLRRIGFDDFRRNGLLLPVREEVAVRLGMPLNRGARIATTTKWSSRRSAGLSSPGPGVEPGAMTRATSTRSIVLRGCRTDCASTCSTSAAHRISAASIPAARLPASPISMPWPRIFGAKPRRSLRPARSLQHRTHAPAARPSLRPGRFP